MGPRGSGGTLNIVYSAGETNRRPPCLTKDEKHPTVVPSSRRTCRAARAELACHTVSTLPIGRSLPSKWYVRGTGSTDLT